MKGTDMENVKSTSRKATKYNDRMRALTKAPKKGHVGTPKREPAPFSLEYLRDLVNPRFVSGKGQ